MLFALTPPRRTTSPEKSQEIADVTLKRLQALDLDGLVLYDIDDESDRNPAERPFPFLPTMDPAEYLARHLSDSSIPVVVYRAVGKYVEPQLRSWLAAQEPDRVLSVFVGTSSHDKPAATSLTRAQALRSQVKPDLLLGGSRSRSAMRARAMSICDCSPSRQPAAPSSSPQVVYDVNAAKNLVSDYRYECAARGQDPSPSCSPSRCAGR